MSVFRVVRTQVARIAELVVSAWVLRHEPSDEPCQCALALADCCHGMRLLQILRDKPISPQHITMQESSSVGKSSIRRSRLVLR